MPYYQNITRTVNALCRRFGTRDPFAIARGSGVHILRADGLRRLKGMYRVIARNRFIILNADNPPATDRIVCAHELGHDQLHRLFAKENPLQEFMLYDMSSRQEYEANLFAAELLLDAAEITDLIRAGYDTVQIAASLHTDINLVALKLDCMNRDGAAFRPQPHDTRFLR